MNGKSAFKKYIELLKSMIEIPSMSREETDVADFLATFMVNEGLQVERKNNNLYVIGQNFSEKKPTILLNAHIDTVRPANGWTYSPFHATVDGDVIYGLGSNDDGASVVALLATFSYLQKTEQQYNLVFVASAEEEVSGKNGIESLYPDLPQCDFAIIGEPTNMQPAIAEKGLMVLDCLSIGKAGHAARNEGDNAIYKALEAINWIRTYQFPKRSELLQEVKMSATVIEAGKLHNMIPDTCRFVVDVRTNECYTNERVLSIIQSNLDCRVTARSTRLNSSSIALNHPFVQRCLNQNLKPFGSPTLSDQALIPIPSLKIGPGDSARSHTANEYIQLSEIEDAIELYIRLLDGLIL